MKKIVALFLVILTLPSLFASFIPFENNRTSSLFTSPTTLLEDRDVPFGFMVDTSSSFNGLKFLSSPLSVTEEVARDMALTLEKKDLDWWRENSDIISVFASFDSSFPTPGFIGGEEDLEEWKIRSYLTSTFLSSSYSKERRAYVMALLADNEELFTEKNPGDTDLYFSFYGEKAQGGFGWGWNVDLGFDGGERLFGGGRSIFSLTLRSPLGYAFPLSDRVSLGLSAVPSLRMETYILSSSYVQSRLQNSFVTLFNEDFRFGMGLEINGGLNYRVNPELYFTLDARNIPSFFTYWGIALTDMASFNLNFNRIKDTWIELPDVVMGAHWRRDGHRVDVEMERIVSQLLYGKEVETYSFDFLLCPNLRYSYFFAPSQSLSLYLSNGLLAFGMDWDGFSFSLSYGGENNDLGMKIGYRVTV